MGTIKTTNIEPIADNGTVTLGSSGDTFTVPSGVTVNMSSATQTGVGGVNTPAFLAYSANGQSQTVSDATTTKLDFETELYDTDSAFSSDTKFTVPSGKAGKYQFTANVSWYHDGGQFSRAFISLYKNGSEFMRFERRGSNIYNGSYSQQSLNFTVDDDASAGDYYEVYGYFENITTTYTSSSFTMANFFKGFKLIT